MRITEQNIDQWLNDYESGRLSGEEAAAAASILEKMLDESPVAITDNPDETLSVEIKASMVRGVSDLNQEQKQILAIARAEGDMNSDELAELENLLSHDKNLREEVEVMEKMKLSPLLNEEYSNKSSLKRRTVILSPGFYYAVSSVAAILIAAVVIGRLLTAPSQPDTTNNLLLSEQTTTPSQQIVEETPIITREVRQSAPVNSVPVLTASLEEGATSNPEPEISRLPADKIPAITLSGQDISVVKTSVATPTMVPVQLMAVAAPLPYGEERSAIRERFAEAFRSLALGEEKPTRDPITPFEIAGAGLNGVNKLLGWNMELAKEPVEGGEQEIIAFNSKLIKVNAPKKVDD